MSSWSRSESASLTSRRPGDSTVMARHVQRQSRVVIEQLVNLSCERNSESEPVVHRSDMGMYPQEGAWRSGVLVDGQGRLHTTTLLHPFYGNRTPRIPDRSVILPVPQREVIGSYGRSAASAVLPTMVGGAFQGRGTYTTSVAPSIVVAGLGPSKESRFARVSAPPNPKRKNAENVPVATDDNNQESKRQRTPSSVRQETRMKFCKANGKSGRGLANFGEFIRESAPVVEIYLGQILDLNLLPQDILAVVSPLVVEDSGCPHVFESVTLAG